MKIKKLEIIGFKSFVEPTVLRFDHEITCIVGPNGCGKSNVVDAIKWVMGEQSANRLRGKAMEDVIFSGAEGRGPHGFAEVTITFDNSDGLAPPEYAEYAEISVARRLDRQGRSDYYINKTPVRLLDVTNLFLGTGVGRRAYSVIEQGRIGLTVSAKPEDRRLMIEEAAGVTKYRARKRAAERKMDQTRQNLLRVTDILSELERNLASLKRQAQKAERYKRYRKEVQDLELYVASHRYLELSMEGMRARAALAEANRKVQEARTALDAKETSVESKRVMLQQLSLEVERRQGKVYELDNRVRQLEALVQQQLDRADNARERQEIAERELGQLQGEREGLQREAGSLKQGLAALESDEQNAADALGRANHEALQRRAASESAEQRVAEARGRIRSAEQEIARIEASFGALEQQRQQLRERVQRLQEERDALSTRRTEIDQQRRAFDARLAGLRSGKVQTAERYNEIESELIARGERLQGAERQVETLREELAVKRSRLRSLSEIQHRFEGAGLGVQALMLQYAPTDELRRDKGLVGLISDRLNCEERFTRALAAALGASLQHIVVSDWDRGMQAVEFLHAHGKGRATLVPREPRGSQPRVIVASPGPALGHLLDFLQWAPEDDAWVRHLLHDVLVASSLGDALALHERGYPGRIVSLEGALLCPDGTITGGSEDREAGHILEIKREAHRLESEVGALEARLQAASEHQGNLRAEIAQRRAEIDVARTAAHDAELSILSADRDLHAAENELRRLSEREQALTSTLQEVREGLSQVDVAEGDGQDRLARTQESLGAAERDLNAAESLSTERRTAVETQLQHVTEMSVLAARSRERAERDRLALERCERLLQELALREERLHGDVEMARQQQGQAGGRVLLHRGRLGETVHESREAREGLAAQRELLDSNQTTLAEVEGSLRKLRAGIDERANEVNQLMLRERELTLELQHLCEQVRDRYRVDVAMILGDYHARPLPDAAVAARVDELQRLIERMGEINLTAIEEYDEKAERYEFLSGQRQDLDSALSQLERAIRQMNRESRALFREAFAGVNERFKRIFPILFRGGKAELRLTDPQDLLESGVEIVAQPPGKRLGSLELMSGGEKALTAVALIFSIFQYKPSPFCLLDEVDAPLDEVNIGRFAESIRQMTDRSQFIIITHSKRTMEFADVLYGVTMEQPGISKLVSVELKGDKRPVPDRETAAA